MPSSEDYTLVWVGILIRLKPNEVKAATDGVHPLIGSARRCRLETWCDTFGATPGKSTTFCMLIGKHLATLGYKEGITQFMLSPKHLERLLIRTALKLRGFQIGQSPKLRVLVHIEDVD